MNNIVDFRIGRVVSRPSTPVAQSGARILFFTGVRYSREPEEMAAPFLSEANAFRDTAPLLQQSASEASLDRAGR